VFVARGIAISFSVFMVTYCVLSVAVGVVWRIFYLRPEQYASRHAADLLFGLRMFPVAAAGLITIAFTIPSFVLLEPRSINEPLGEIPLALGLAGCGLGIFGVVNALRAIRRASETISAWTGTAQPLRPVASVPVLRITQTVPAMTAIGIVRPRVLLSGAAESLLSTCELNAALNHELAHVRRRDNLKKLLLRFVAFPGMAGLEAAWLEATEMAADDAAVSSSAEALDLAAALIKVSRLGPVETPAELTAALVHSPASVMNARVGRLIAWNEQDHQPAGKKYSAWYGASAALVTFTAFAISYVQLLQHVHTATEWLVR